MNRKAVLFLSGFLALMPMLAFAQDAGEGESTPLDALSTFALWSIAAGFIGTFVVAIINRSTWPSTAKFGVFFVWCCLAAAVTAYFKRELDLANWSRALLLVFVAGQALYMAGKPAIKEIEVATT